MPSFGGRGERVVSGKGSLKDLQDDTTEDRAWAVGKVCCVRGAAGRPGEAGGREARTPGRMNSGGCGRVWQKLGLRTCAKG